MANPFVYTELNTSDVPGSKTFYSKLFDWKLEDVSGMGMDYTFIKNGDTPIGGMMKHPMPGAPSMWLPYVGVDDIKASTAKAKSLGAKVIVDVREVPGHGHMSVLSDPTGSTIALWQPIKA
jgi:predicted enzyme related to lactoylglutathione lyase